MPEIATDLQPLAVAIPTAAKMTGVSRALFYRLIKAGKVRTCHIAGRRVVRISEIDRLLTEATE